MARAYSRREAVELYTAAGANDAGFVGAALAAALKYDSRRAPGVRSWVIFGTGSPTLQTLIFPALKGVSPTPGPAGAEEAAESAQRTFYSASNTAVRYH